MIPNSDLAIVATSTAGLHFKTSIDDSWFTEDIDHSWVLSLGISESDCLIALVMDNQGNVYLLTLPSLGLSDPIVEWHGGRVSSEYASYSWRFTNWHGLIWPKPPQAMEWYAISAWYDMVGASIAGEIDFHSERIHYSCGPVSEWTDDFGQSLQRIYDSASPDGIRRLVTEWEHSNDYGWRYELSFEQYRADQDSIFSRPVYRGQIDYLMSTPETMNDRGLCIVRKGTDDYLIAALPELPGGQTDSLIAFNFDDEEMAWRRPGNYHNIHAANVDESTYADEILCLDPYLLRFVVLTDKGNYVGTTDLFQGNPNDIRIIAPHGPNTMMAVRDGDTLRFYSFGDISILISDNAVSLPSSFSLTAYPNPFNPVTTIRFAMPNAGRVMVDVYNIAGQKVSSITDRCYDAGMHTAMFDGAALPSGVYFARLDAGRQQLTHKLLLIR